MKYMKLEFDVDLLPAEPDMQAYPRSIHLVENGKPVGPDLTDFLELAYQFGHHRSMLDEICEQAESCAN